MSALVQQLGNRQRRSLHVVVAVPRCVSVMDLSRRRHHNVAELQQQQQQQTSQTRLVACVIADHADSLSNSFITASVIGIATTILFGT